MSTQHRSNTILVIDAATPTVQVGILQAERFLHSACSTQKPLEAIFELTQEALAKHPLESLDAYAFCHGPGSTLGIRTAAIAIRAWNTLHPKPIYHYGSLHLAQALTNHPIATPSRKGFYWHLPTESDQIEELDTFPQGSQLLQPSKLWEQLPPTTTTVNYDLASAPHSLPALLQPTTHPDVLRLREESFQKWSPKRHQ